MSDDKKRAAEKSVSYIKDGMIVGLGSGSTVNLMLKELGKRVKGGLDIKGIPSSKKTERLANELDIPLIDFSSIDRIDIAIDGADEVDSGLNVIKGGGGSLVREKIIAAAAEKLIIVIDASKKVYKLGRFPLAIEVVPFGWEMTSRNIEALGGLPILRKQAGRIFLSDNGNYILDCKFDEMREPKELHEKIKGLIGVVETGLFIDMLDEIMIASDGEVTIIRAGEETWRDGSE